MKLLNGSIRPMYFKYLSAAFGSAMITSVYSIVDTAMVGQYHGPEAAPPLRCWPARRPSGSPCPSRRCWS